MHGGEEALANQGALAAAAHAGDGDEAVQREADGEVLEVVRRGVGEGEKVGR